jgi:hypothetical protein
MTGQKQTQKQDRTQPTRRRSDAGQVRLTLRDLEALRWIAEQYVIAGSALPLLLRVAPGGARKWTQRMRRAGLIQSAVVNWTTWYWPTARAMHDLDLAWPATRPKAVQLPHLRAVGAVRLWHAASTPQLHWVAERVVRAREQRIGNGFRPPDAELWDASGSVLVAAVEVELHAKPPDRVRTVIADRLARYPQVQYVCADHIDGVVQRACVDLAAARPDLAPLERVQVRRLANLIADLHPPEPPRTWGELRG